MRYHEALREAVLSGLLKSDPHTGQVHRKLRSGEWSPQKPYLRNGYRAVGWAHKGQNVNSKVCHIVLETHGYPRPSPDHHCDHKNRIKTDDWLENLHWVTRSQNNANRDKSDWTGEKNGRARLTREQVQDARVRILRGESQTAVAREYGVSDTTLGDMMHGKTWGWLPWPVVEWD